MTNPKLEVRGYNLDKIRNRNEHRVAECMETILEEYCKAYDFEQLDIEDIYALSLNLLPARYTQKGTIVIQNRVSDDEIEAKVRQAIEKILDHPTRGD